MARGDCSDQILPLQACAAGRRLDALANGMAKKSRRYGALAAEVVRDRHDKAQLRHWLLTALARLSERERHVVAQRKLIDDPRTLESLGAEMGLSKERIRQLEAVAYAKLKRGLEQRSPEVQALLA
jgi:RNA polymerase sigma-32 factor